MSNGTNHFRETDDVPPLSEQQAREQLRHALRNQLGRLSFETKYDEGGRHDGVVIAKINGEQVDHYGFVEDDDGSS